MPGSSSSSLGKFSHASQLGRRCAVITLELLRVIRDGQPVEAELAARVRADGSDITIEGPEPELVDRTQPVLNLRDGTTITCTDNPEEWVRGLGSVDELRFWPFDRD